MGRTFSSRTPIVFVECVSQLRFVSVLVVSRTYVSRIRHPSPLGSRGSESRSLPRRLTRDFGSAPSTPVTRRRTTSRPDSDGRQREPLSRVVVRVAAESPSTTRLHPSSSFLRYFGVWSGKSSTEPVR